MTEPLRPVRIAVVGCGAVTEGFHLPVLAGDDDVVVTALVDPDLARARRLAALYRIPNTFASLDDIDRNVADAALVATPAFLHASGSIALMQRGLHVLVEKPMALTSGDAERMVKVAGECGVVLTVGLFRRLLPAIRLLKAEIVAGNIGAIRRVDAEVGDAYTWQLTTMAGMQRERAGGGALADMGPHVLDLLQYVCGEPLSFVRYSDNGSTGIETDCVVTLERRGARGRVPVRMELSRTRKLRNTIRVEGTSGVLEWVFGERSRLLVNSGRRLVDDPQKPSRPVVTEAKWGDEIEQFGYEGFRAQIDDWVTAIREGTPAELSGESVLPIVRLMEECYLRRTSLPEPWFTEGLSRASRPQAAEQEAGPRVLVTGASGFIGARLVERLHYGSNWRPRALIRTPGRAVRLARMPVEFALGDLSSPTDLAKALEGCDAVVHAGIGTSWRASERIAINVQGTKHLVDAAIRAGVKRFVHLSTLSVYGDHVTGVITEDTRVNPKKGWDYAESKYQAEQIVLEAAGRGLPAIVLRVAVVYGPHNMTIVVRPIEALQQDRLVLVESANLPSNTIYVDNLCESIRLALDAPKGVNGQIILVSDDDGYTWGDYFGYFADRIGAVVQHASKPAGTLQPTGAAQRSFPARWLAGTLELATSPEAKAMAKRIYTSEPWGTPARWAVEKFPGVVQAVAARVRPPEGMVYRRRQAPAPAAPFKVDPIAAHVSADKARRILGPYTVVPRAHAMALTLEWARYARVAPSHSSDAASQVDALEVEAENELV